MQYLPLRRDRRAALGFCLALLLLGTALIAAGWYGRRSREYKSDQFLMDTLVSIRVYGEDEGALRDAVAAAYGEMHRIADLADCFPQPGTAACDASDICRINAQAGVRPVRVQPETLEMLALAERFSSLSDGAFDVTIGPVMNLWGFAGENPQVPPSARIEEALALVDRRELVVDRKEQTVFLRRVGMRLDLGAVAKGYATEKAAQVLQRYGIEKALIDAGGNIRVLGRNVRNAPWQIGIKDPRRSDAIVGVLSLEDAAAVTSGDYYRFFEADGKRYHHILDPRSGYPAEKNMSVTAVTTDAGLADVLSTAFFVLDPERALELAKKIDGVELFLVAADGRIFHTPGLQERIEVRPGEGYSFDPGR